MKSALKRLKEKTVKTKTLNCISVFIHQHKAYTICFAIILCLMTAYLTYAYINSHKQPKRTISITVDRLRQDFPEKSGKNNQVECEFVTHPKDCAFLEKHNLTDKCCEPTQNETIGTD